VRFSTTNGIIKVNFALTVNQNSLKTNRFSESDNRLHNSVFSKTSSKPGATHKNLNQLGSDAFADNTKTR